MVPHHQSPKGLTMSLQDASSDRNESNSSGQRRSPRGFAAMDPQRQREIASLGGRAAHQSGHAHEFTSEEARAAGRKRHARSGSSSK
jgi:general stress protein YciG